MSMFFDYDNLAHKHQIYAFPVKDDNGKEIGFKADVHRHETKGINIVERISDKFPELTSRVFETNKEARQASIDFFRDLKYHRNND